MNGDMAPGPDRYKTLLFKMSWHVVGESQYSLKTLGAYLVQGMEQKVNGI